MLRLGSPKSYTWVLRVISLPYQLFMVQYCWESVLGGWHMISMEIILFLSTAQTICPVVRWVAKLFYVLSLQQCDYSDQHIWCYRNNSYLPFVMLLGRWMTPLSGILSPYCSEYQVSHALASLVWALLCPSLLLFPGSRFTPAAQKSLGPLINNENLTCYENSQCFRKWNMLLISLTLILFLVCLLVWQHSVIVIKKI